MFGDLSDRVRDYAVSCISLVFFFLCEGCPITSFQVVGIIRDASFARPICGDASAGVSSWFRQKIRISANSEVGRERQPAQDRRKDRWVDDDLVSPAVDFGKGEEAASSFGLDAY